MTVLDTSELIVMLLYLNDIRYIEIVIYEIVSYAYVILLSD